VCEREKDMRYGYGMRVGVGVSDYSMCSCIYAIFAYTRPRTHTHIHTRTHTLSHRHTPTHTHTRSRIHTHTHTHTHLIPGATYSSNKWRSSRKRRNKWLACIIYCRVIHVRRDLFTCNVTHSYVTWLICTWHDSFMREKLGCLYMCFTWLTACICVCICVCDVTQKEM